MSCPLDDMAACPVISDQENSSDWAFLPTDILMIILEKLTVEVSDYVHFAAVCKNWYSTAHDHHVMTPKLSFFPELLIPTKDESDTQYQSCYNVMENRIVNCRLRVPRHKRCCGSSHGWLIFVEENSGLTVFNPFTGSTIHLPPVFNPMSIEHIINQEEDKEADIIDLEGYYYDPEYRIQKVILSTDPSLDPENFEALAIIGHSDLAYFRPGMSSWVHVKSDGEWSLPYREVTYFNGKFYAATIRGMLICLDVFISGTDYNSVSLKERRLAFRWCNTSMVHKVYLAGTQDGRLLWIDRHYSRKWVRIGRDDRGKSVEYFEIGDEVVSDNNDEADEYGRCHYTSDFMVYELGNIQGEPRISLFKRTKTLDGQVLFVGHNDSFMLPSHKYNMANRIYFMDDCLEHFDVLDHYTSYPYGAADIGYFDIDARCCKQLEQAVARSPGKGHMPPPIWILPNLNLQEHATF